MPDERRSADTGREARGDLDVLLRARQGDQSAARSLVATHSSSMLRAARAVLLEQADSEGDDVVQEAFIAALTTTALPTGDAGAWLRAIAARKALDAMRRVRRRGEEPLPDPTREEATFAVSIDPERRIDGAAARQWLSRLSPVDRAVLLLVDVEGHSMAEAAAMMGITRIAAKLRAMRARRKLANLMMPPSKREGSGP
jgi:RNA polymerase sigma-70 factor (ECF subfamily)